MEMDGRDRGVAEAIATVEAKVRTEKEALERIEVAKEKAEADEPNLEQKEGDKPILMVGTGPLRKLSPRQTPKLEKKRRLWKELR
jgi:hypothetical protein